MMRLPWNCWIFFLVLENFSCVKNHTQRETAGTVTDTTIAAVSLFQKYEHNPIFNIGSMMPVWRSIHTANVSLLQPSQTTDNKWRLFMRGSGNNADGYHDNIGTFVQDTVNFSPYGPWLEQINNPNLKHGGVGTCDEKNVLDAAAVSAPGQNISLYYMGRDASNRSGLCVATSTDGGISFTKFYDNPLKKDVGPNDAVFSNNQYFVFYGDAKWTATGFKEPLQIWLSESKEATILNSTPTYALKVGGYGSFDSYSVNGAKIFKASGDKRWFMLYQCSAKSFDYPERFHCAYSDDLINWTKVTNTKPLLTRGKAGEFDQGAIWTGSVIENKGSLYIFYEGWGSFSNDSLIRDSEYYGGGNSRVGIASCSVKDFLAWVNQ